MAETNEDIKNKELKYNNTSEIKIPKIISEQIIGQDEALKVIKKAASQRRNVLLIGEPGTGKCVGKEVIIPTNKGNYSSEELYNILFQESAEYEKEDGIYIIPKKDYFAYSINNNGKIINQRIIKAYKSNLRKKCIQVKTRSGAEIKLSGEHPILTIEKGILLFKDASELKKGINISLARRIPLINKNKIELKENEKNIIYNKNLILYKGINGISSLSLKIPEELNKEIAYFLGVYVAEGSYSKGLEISNYNEKIKNRIKEIAVKNFKYPEKFIVINKKGVNFKKSRTLAYILEKYFDQKVWDYKNKKILSKQSQHKRVPNLIQNAGKDIIFAFLSGYMDGDGHFDKEGFEASSANKDLIQDLRLILLKLGILSRTNSKVKYASNTKNKIKRNYFYLTITGNENLKELDKNLELLVDYKKAKLNKLTLKKANTNIDLIYGVAGTLKELKKNIKINYKSYKITSQAFNRYVRGKQTPSRNYIKVLVNNLEKDINLLKLRKELMRSYINYIDLLESKIYSFKH